MRFQTLEQNHRRRVRVGPLNGGLNRRDAAHQLEDQQLSAVSNMWWKDGALRTRPGVVTDEDQMIAQPEDAYAVSAFPAGEDSDSLATCGGRRILYVVDKGDRGGGETYTYYPGRLLYDGTIAVGEKGYSIAFMNLESGMALGGTIIEYNADELGKLTGRTDLDGGMMLLGSGEFFALPSQPTQDLVSLKPYFYIPTVLVNGTGITTTPTNPAISGMAYEAYNMATPFFKASYTTDGTATVFYLPQKGLDAEEITAVYTSASGTVYTHTVPANASTGNMMSDGLKLYCNRTAGYVSFLDTYGAKKAVAASVANNLVVTAAKTQTEHRQLFYKMRTYTWFGGDRSSLRGGTRLFLTGNPQFPSRLIWSAVDNPLYFPATNYAMVGNADQRITALKKQGDRLIIFKEREIYAAEYVADQFSADEVKEGTYADVAPKAAYFPLVLLHSGVGCDCPETIHLCLNRLVWLHSSGRVYTLIDDNAFSDSNVRCLSYLIEKTLKEFTKQQLQQASAGDYQGYYGLLIGNRSLWLDYTSGAFERYTNTYSDEKSQRRLSWYTWDFSGIGADFSYFMARDDSAVLLGSVGETGGAFDVAFTLGGETDSLVQTAVDDSDGAVVITPGAIVCSFSTKWFSFDGKETRKTISRLLLEMGDGVEESLTVTYLIDDGIVAGSPPSLTVPAGRPASLLALAPSLSGVHLFGVKVSCNGRMAIDGFTMYVQIFR